MSLTIATDSNASIGTASASNAETIATSSNAAYNENLPQKGDESIFNAENLKTEFQSVKDEQGAVRKAWDGIKNLTGIGVSSNKVQDKIEQYENGKLTYEEALDYIEEYETKQDNAVDLLTGIAIDVTAAGITIATGGAGAIVASTIAGAALKAGAKTLDRATNKIEDDALNSKQIAQDTISGAINGFLNALIVGKIKKSLVQNHFALGLSEAKAGFTGGLLSGSADYMSKVTFDDDTDFKVMDLSQSSAQDAGVSAITGFILGSGMELLLFL